MRLPQIPRFGFEWAFLAIGVVVLVITYMQVGSSEVKASTCELDRVMSGGYATCEVFNGAPWYLLGGAFAVIGLFAIVMRDALEGLFVRPSRPAPAVSMASELQKAEALLTSGAISADEFAALKKTLLGS